MCCPSECENLQSSSAIVWRVGAGTGISPVPAEEFRYFHVVDREFRIFSEF
eukprot:COSAG05_NODE_1726_length_4205_cov_2.730151_5_plen_51_part_00